MQDKVKERLEKVASLENSYNTEIEKISNTYDKRLKIVIRIELLSLAFSGIVIGAMIFTLYSYINLKNKGENSYKYYMIIWIISLILGLVFFFSYIVFTVYRIKLVNKKEDSLHQLSLKHNEEINKFNMEEKQ